MKRRILFVVMVLLSLPAVHSQDVFPKSDAIWNVRMPTDCGDRYAILLGLMGDTLVNDTTYQKLYLLNDTILRKESIEHYMGAIREQDQKVWFRVDSVRGVGEKYDSREFLLCDFSLKAGDGFTYGDILFIKDGVLDFPSIIYDDNSNGQIKYNTIGWVDSITVDDKGRRHFYLKYWGNYQDEWVEGIGSLHGLFLHFYYPPMYQLGENDKSKLQCMKYKDEVQYKIDENWYSCDKCFCMSQFAVSINEEVAGQIRLYVPESCKKSIRIEIPDGSSPCLIELYDTSGLLVSTQTMRENTVTINLDNLSGGTYIYRISRYGKALQRGKILIN